MWPKEKIKIKNKLAAYHGPTSDSVLYFLSSGGTQSEEET